MYSWTSLHADIGLTKHSSFILKISKPLYCLKQNWSPSRFLNWFFLVKDTETKPSCIVSLFCWEVYAQKSCIFLSIHIISQAHNNSLSHYSKCRTNNKWSMDFDFKSYFLNFILIERSLRCTSFIIKRRDSNKIEYI